MVTDTPKDIQQKQLEIWLSKPPMERLRITLEDNDALFGFWEELRKNYKGTLSSPVKENRIIK